MKRLIALLALATALTWLPTAGAATGDIVGTVNFSNNCSLGVGIAFDGTNLWYSCAGNSPDLLRANPTTGVVNASYTIANGLGALSYDATRNVIWAAEGFGSTPGAGPVLKIDLDAGQNVVGSSLAFVTGLSCGLTDGLAFDANGAGPADDVIYYSNDCFTTTIRAYDLTGVLVESFPTCVTGGHNSGLAVGGQLLFQADLFNNSTCVVDKTTKAAAFSYSTAVPGDPNFHAEDMECDTSTFAAIGKHVMWSIEAFSPRRAHAFEIPTDTCGIGGEPPEPEIALTLDPPTATNEVGTSHTVTANLTSDGEPLEDGMILFSVSGANTAAGSDTTDAAGDADFSYSGANPGTDAIVACYDADASGTCDEGELTAEVEKIWVDTTAPTASCEETNNPSGGNVPMSGPNAGNSGQNPDGFYQVSYADGVAVQSAVIADSASPFTVDVADGEKVKIVQAPGAEPNWKPGAGDIDKKITLKGDAILMVTDTSGNTTAVSCNVPPPPK